MLIKGIQIHDVAEFLHHVVDEDANFRMTAPITYAVEELGWNYSDQITEEMLGELFDELGRTNVSPIEHLYGGGSWQDYQNGPNDAAMAFILELV
jgi:hypothetical protein